MGSLVKVSKMIGGFKMKVSGYVTKVKWDAEAMEHELTMVTDPGFDSSPRLVFKASEVLLSYVREAHPLLGRYDMETLLSERAIPIIDPTSTASVEFIQTANGSLPLLSIFTCSGSSTLLKAARESIGTGMTGLFASINVKTGESTRTIRAGDVIATTNTKGDPECTVDTTFVVVAISVPIDKVGTLAPNQAKLLALRVKLQGRNPPKRCNIMNSKGTQLATFKKGEWPFVTVSLVDSMRGILHLGIDKYFEHSMAPKAAMHAMFGEQLMAQIDRAINAGLQSLEVVRNELPVDNTFNCFLKYARNLNPLFNMNDIVGTSPLSGCNSGHAELVLRSTIWAIKHEVENTYSKLGSEIKDSTLMEAHEVRHRQPPSRRDARLGAHPPT